MPMPAPAHRSWNVDWEKLVGIKLFSWIAGIALVLAAVFLFKYSVDHGWLRPPIRAAFGLVVGTALLIVCELRIARNYRFTANAMDGAGIAILYATLFAMHSIWGLVPAPVSFLGMLVVTAAAVYLSTRRDSVFIALLGLIGGFSTPALLSSDENRPVALFSYLLLLNGGISWIAYRKRWPLLTALSVALTAFYQWTWVDEFLTTGELPLAAGIFALFAVVGASALWDGHADERQRIFRRIAAGAAVLPLIFAFFTAIVPEYGARFNVLFGFLLLTAGGLAAIAHWRGPEWLHTVGGVATLVTFFIWLAASYTPQSWPWSLLWLGLFVALYLVPKPTYVAGLLFFAFAGIAVREPQRYGTLLGAMFALLLIVLIVSVARTKPAIAAIALAFSSIAVMALEPPLPVLVAAHGVVFAAILALAFIAGRPILAPLALPFYLAALLIDDSSAALAQLALAFVPYGIFIAYPLLLGARVKQSLAPHLAAAIASAIFFFSAHNALTDLGFEDSIGLLPLALAFVMLLLLWRLLKIERVPARLALVAATALAFITTAIPLQFSDEWIPIAWALEAAALAWLYTRVPHRGLQAWSAMLAVAVLVWLTSESSMYEHRHAYLVAGASMFFAAYVTREPQLLRGFFAGAGTIELFVLMNVEIAAYYARAATSSLARDLTYTICWAAFALVMLVAGIALNTRAARVAALGLLLVTILKCFLHDLASLGGLYRVASLFGLAVSLVLVGLLLQKFVIMKSAGSRTSPAPNGTT